AQPGLSSPTIATIAAAATAAAATTTAAAATAAAAAAVATTAATTTGAGLALLGNADAERTTFEVRTVELGDRFLSVCVAAHGDEREAARTARLAVNHQLGLGHFAGLAERAQEHVLGGVE